MAKESDKSNIRFIQYLEYLGFRLGVLLLAHLPFALLYQISNGIAFLLNSVIGYRKKVVQDNLRFSFPNRSEREINQITKAFYLHLSDLLVEGLKGLYLSKSALLKRYHFENPEVINQFYEKGAHVILMPPHYGNWEWGVLSLPIQVKHEIIGVYKPIRNPLIEAFMGKRRTRLGLQLAPIYITRQTFENPPDTPSLYIMMSDQNPSNRRKAQWVDFLNRQTACLYGADRWARKLNYPVIYMHIERQKRGYYKIHLEEIHRNPKETSDGEITKKFMQMLEQHLHERPSDWLWSHKRWKYTRESLVARGIIPPEE